MDILTSEIVDIIERWCAKENLEAMLTKSIPTLTYFRGGVNSINPFSITSIKNELGLYGKIVFPDTNVFKNKINASTFKKIDAKYVEKYEDIFIDMNGSMAWYPDFIENLGDKAQDFKNKVRKVFVMGGVETRSIDTMMAMPGILNRLTYSTMNQLYHPEGTDLFFENFQDRLVFVTNNEVNDNFTFPSVQVLMESLVEMKLVPKHNFDPTTNSNLPPPPRENLASVENSQPQQTDNTFHIIYHLCETYYKTQESFKPFDVLTAYAMCNHIKNSGKDGDYTKIALLYNKVDAGTIIDDAGTIIDDAGTIIDYAGKIIDEEQKKKIIPKILEKYHKSLNNKIKPMYEMEKVHSFIIENKWYGVAGFFASTGIIPPAITPALLGGKRKTKCVKCKCVKCKCVKCVKPKPKTLTKKPTKSKKV